jgi:hypothetical protein
MKKIYIILVITLISFNTFSQDDEYINAPDGFFSLNFNPSFPTGTLYENISESSFRGFMFEGKRFLNKNLAIGGSLSWTGFYELKDRQTYEFDNGAITGNVANYYYNFPILLNASYYFIPESIIKPYVGINAGTVYNKLEKYVGTLYLSDITWQFHIAPELGVFVPFGKNAQAGIQIAGRYNYITYQKYKYNGIQYFQLSVGLAWLL